MSCEIRKLLLNLSVGVRVVHKPGKRTPSVEGLSGHKWEVRLEALHGWYTIDLVTKKAVRKHFCVSYRRL